MMYVRIQAIPTGDLPELLCRMLNGVFPAVDTFKYENFCLVINEDQMAKVFNDGIYRDKYLDICALHKQLLEIKKRS